MDDDIIFGKNTQQRIVALEPKDNLTELFVQQPDGSITSEFVKNEYFVLAHDKISERWTKLKGDNYYQWGRKFDDRDTFLACRGALKHRDIFSIYDAKESFMVKTGNTYFKGMKHTELDVLSFDIETTGLVKDNTSKVILISNTFRSSKGVIEKKLFSYDEHENDGEMIEAWYTWVREKNPSILLGHNICGYDLPYLAHVADMHGKDLLLGRDGSKLWFNGYESRFRKDQSQYINYFKSNCYGRNIIDTMFLAIKADIGKHYDSYGLKSIIKTEGLEKSDRVFYDASQIRNNYLIPDELLKIKTYCIDDSDDALALFDLYCPPFFYSTQSVPKSFQQVTETASGSQINAIMLRSYIQHGHSIPRADDIDSFEGGISKGYPGIHNNVYKIDINAMYPSVMLEYGISNKIKDPEENLVKMLEYFTNERLKNKALAQQTNEQYYKHLEQTAKVFINSTFGFLGAPGLNFNDKASAAKVTEIGRSILLRSMKWAEDKTFQLTSVDTDSIAFRKEDYAEFTKEEQKDLLDEINSLFPTRIRFAHDGYYKKSLVFKAKTYVLYDGAKIIVKGSALKSSQLEMGFREFINEMLKSILEDKNDYKQLYDKYVRRLCNITTKEDIKLFSSKKTLTNTTYSSTRTNETKLVDALEGVEVVVGDRVWVFFLPDGSLCLSEGFKGEYDKDKMLEKLYKVSRRFAGVVDVTYLLNYKLKKNKMFLEEVLR